MFQLEPGDRRPLYEQIKENIKFLIIGGSLADGDRIPSVRELAVNMAINPNTIQKAYKELENEGYIHSLKAKGYFVSPRSQAEKAAGNEVLAKFTDAARELMYTGKTFDELCGIIEQIYKGGNIDGNDNGQ
ncbi:MAG: GntR family transcriptional regulator [Clostridia bacterium]|nr:GntR family transcriptional regulator [Clostridia bacterium]